MKKTSKRWKPLVGCWLQMPSHWTCEIIASVGYDAIFIDGEHGAFGPESMDMHVALAKSLGLAVYCRVATPTRPHIQQTLDAAADALVLPQVRNLAHAREATELAKYPPLGTRGMGVPRSLNYRDTPADFVVTENARTKCFVMIETPGALADVKKIAALPAVDGLFMGPYDLSLTRGRGQYGRSSGDLADADRIARAAADAGKLLGMPAFGDDDIKRAKRYGACVLTVADDISGLIEGLGNGLVRFKARNGSN